MDSKPWTQKIYQTLGQSVNFEEGRGNFDEAKKQSEEWLSQVETSGDNSWLSAALFWQGLILLLQGDIKEAHSFFDKAEAAAGNNADQLLLIHSYRLLAVYEQYNTLPDGAGAGEEELTARWRGAEDLQEPSQRWEELRASATDSGIQFEAWYIFGFLCNLKPARYMLESTHFSPSSIDLRAQILQPNVQMAMELSQNAWGSGVFGMAVHATWIAADLYRRSGDSIQARQVLDQAEARAREANDMAGLALCRMSRADWLCAPFSSPVSWNLALKGSSSEGSALTVNQEAEEYTPPSGKDITTARQLYEEALHHLKDTGAPRLRGALYLRLGYLCMLEKAHQQTLDYTREAAAIFEKSGDFKNLQLARLHQLMAGISNGQLTGLESLAQKIGEWGAATGSFSYTLGLGIILNRFARHQLIREGHFEGALSAYRAALALHESLGARLNCAQNMADLALVQQAVGNMDSALTWYGRALDAYQALPGDYARQLPAGESILPNIRHRIILLATNAYQLALQQIDPDAMERYAGRLQDQLGQLPAGGGLGGLLGNMVKTVFSGEGPDLQQGVESWALHQMGQAIIEQAAVLAPLYRARRYQKGGDEQQFDTCWRQALEAALEAKSGNRHFFEMVVWSEQKNYDKAADAFRKHLEAGGANAGFTGTLTKLMRSAGGQAGQEEARLQLRRNHQQALSIWVRLEKYKEALSHLRALEDMDGPDWWRHDNSPWQLLCDAGELYDGLNDFPAALSCFEKAISELEARRDRLSRIELKTALSGNRNVQNLYFLAARTAMKNKDFEGAFLFAEQGKAKSLLDLMAAGSLFLEGTAEESDLVRSWRRLNAERSLWQGLAAQERGRDQPDEMRLQQWEERIDHAESELAGLEKKLLTQMPDFFNAVSVEAPVLNVSETANQLPDQALLVAYYFLNDDLLVWCIDGGGLVRAIHFELDTAQLDRDILSFHRACAGRKAADDLDEQLSVRLLQPLEQIIGRYERLFVVPYGSMHLLPFHALRFGGNYLGATHTISYLPGASALPFLKDPGPSVFSKVFVAGNPTGDLPAASAEAGYVASLFGTKALTGIEATKEVVVDKISEASLLHLATHGRLSEEAPLSSALALSGGEELTLYELMGLRLSADLVVLSACDTARGERTPGDDVLGLTRGLFAAGAKAAVVSLWEVDDISTSLFMGAFYRQLKEGAPPAIALQQAQNYLRDLPPEAIDQQLKELEQDLSEKDIRKAVRKSRKSRDLTGFEKPAEETPADYGHPFYWAPFILIGR